MSEAAAHAPLRRRFAALRTRARLLARPRAPETLPAKLERNRIYVLPTRFGLFFAIAMLAMGLGALNYNNNPALMLCLLLAGTANASLVAAHLQLSGLRMSAFDADPVAAGKPLALRLHFAAGDARARNGLRVELGASHAWFGLDDGLGEATLQVPTTHRGWMDVERIRISTTRPLGLAVAWAYLWPDAPVLVYPAPEPAGPPLPSGRGDDARARLHPAGDDVHHLRGYRRGDARRSIAWKPSARRDALLVREYEQPTGADVVLSWLALDGLRYEERIARLARWIDEAERDGRRYRLELPLQPALGPDQGHRHRHACLRALALLPAAPRA